MFKICVSLAERGLDRILSALQGLELAEIRLDRADLSLPEIDRLFRVPVELVASYRPGASSDERREASFIAAISAGAAYVDVELDSPPGLKEKVLAEARLRSCRVIVSHHDLDKTPSRAELDRLLEACFAAGADIAKIACRVSCPADCARLLSLYETTRPLIALGLGPSGLITRIAGPLLGAPFTYAAFAPGRETAEGQPDAATLRAIFERLGHG